MDFSSVFLNSHLSRGKLVRCVNLYNSLTRRWNHAETFHLIESIRDHWSEGIRIVVLDFASSVEARLHLLMAGVATNVVQMKTFVRS